MVEAIEHVEQFTYLGGLITADGNSERDKQKLIGCTSQATGKMLTGYRQAENKAS